MLLRCYWFTILVQYVFKQIKRKRLRWSFSWLFLMKDKCYSDYCGRNLTVFTYCFPWIAYQWGNRLFSLLYIGEFFSWCQNSAFSVEQFEKKNFFDVLFLVCLSADVPTLGTCLNMLNIAGQMALRPHVGFLDGRVCILLILG